MSDAFRDLAAMSSTSFNEWHAGYTVGYRHGLDAGREHERAEVASLQRAAAETVRKLADLDERDRDADEAQAERRRAWWSRRRGEHAAGMSTRAIASVTGVHKDTVRNDLSGGEYSPPAPAVNRETGEILDNPAPTKRGEV